MITGISGLIICVITALVFILIRAKFGANVWGILTKTLASICFVFTGLIIICDVWELFNAFMLIGLGLICGLIGDIILELKVVYKEHSNIYLNAGMLSFSIGHILYLIAGTIIATANNVKVLVPALIGIGASIVLTGVIMFISLKVLKLNFGKHFYQTIGYTFLLLFAVIYLVGLTISLPALLLLTIGEALILISDLILSQQYFGGKQDSTLFHILNHALYYAGQIVIVLFIFCYVWM